MKTELSMLILLHWVLFRAYSCTYLWCVYQPVDKSVYYYQPNGLTDLFHQLILNKIVLLFSSVTLHFLGFWGTNNHKTNLSLQIIGIVKQWIWCIYNGLAKVKLLTTSVWPCDSMRNQISCCLWEFSSWA